MEQSLSIIIRDPLLFYLLARSPSLPASMTVCFLPGGSKWLTPQLRGSWFWWRESSIKLRQSIPNFDTRVQAILCHARPVKPSIVTPLATSVDRAAAVFAANIRSTLPRAFALTLEMSTVVTKQRSKVRSLFFRAAKVSRLL